MIFKNLIQRIKSSGDAVELKKRKMVAKYAAGSNSLQFGKYTTSERFQARKTAIMKCKFV